MLSTPDEFKDIKIKREDVIDDSFLSNDENENEEEDILERYQREPRVLLLKWAIVIALTVLIGKAGYLQIVKSGLYQNAAEGNSTRILAVKSTRGIIYDRDLDPLVQNVASLDVIAMPSDLPLKDADKMKDITETLSLDLKMEKEEIEKILKTADRYSSSPILIKNNIDHDEAIVIESKADKLKGISVEKNAIRNYPDSTYFSPILGYSGKVSADDLKSHTDYLMTDSIGKTGLENIYEDELRGKYGKDVSEVNALGQKKRLISKEDPQAGSNLELYLDKDLQKKLYDEILNKTRNRSNFTYSDKKYGNIPMAAAVAIDPRNGGVLALISMPSYDNNLFAKGISAKDYNALINNPNSPLINRAISGKYPPGSTFKPLMASAVLNENIINPSKIIECHGFITVGNYIYRDWKTHGPINMIDAIAMSSDVYFYTVGGGYGDIKGLGIDRIKKYASSFGFNQRSGIDLPGESAGLIPDANWKKEAKKEPWYLGDTYHASIGQGDVLATPLQIANYIAAVANGGKLYKPQMVQKILDTNNNVIKNIDPVVLNENFIQSKNLKIVQEGMRTTVTRGTARLLNDLPVTSAGKTGTAQFGPNKDMHSWFTVYAPYENPEIAMAILVEGGGEGNELAVPIANDVLQWYFNKKKEPNDSPEVSPTK